MGCCRIVANPNGISARRERMKSREALRASVSRVIKIMRRSEKGKDALVNGDLFGMRCWSNEGRGDEE